MISKTGKANVNIKIASYARVGRAYFGLDDMRNKA